MNEKTLHYKLITNKRALQAAIKRAGQYCALDFETTALVPSEGRVRLVSLKSPTLNALVDFDRISGGFRAVADLFETDTTWIAFNSGFELRWFMNAGATPGVRDVENLRRAIMGGSRLSLALMAKWDLDREVDKTQQNSAWGNKVLTQEQLDYAFDDAVVTWDLWEHWFKKIDKGRMAAFLMFDDMVPAVIEMEDAGMLLDRKRHRQIIDRWEKIQAMKIEVIRELVEEDEVANINSDKQWSDYFAKNLPVDFLNVWDKTEKTGQLAMTSKVLRTLAGSVEASEGNNPLSLLFDTLADYKKISKYLSSFGETLLTKADLSGDGRVRCRFNIGAAKTGRFSCSGPNLQQIPRDQSEFFGEALSIRQSFVAGLGRQLVSYDYSGIELRVLALLTDDKQLLADMIEGDVHSEVASFMAGRTIDKSIPEDKEIRSAAKGVSFGIIYGSGAAGLSATLRTAPENAQTYIDFWQDRYPNAFRLRYDKLDEAEKTRQIRMADGGTVYMGKHPDLPKCANYPVQRAALAIMARAIARHKATLDQMRKQNMLHSGSRMLSTIHDALIDEAWKKDAAFVSQLMADDMTQGYLDVFPGAPTESLIEGGVGPNWGELD